jgi:hypothetical protein
LPEGSGSCSDQPQASSFVAPHFRGTHTKTHSPLALLEPLEPLELFDPFDPFPLLPDGSGSGSGHSGAGHSGHSGEPHGSGLGSDSGSGSSQPDLLDLPLPQPDLLPFDPLPDLPEGSGSGSG